MVEKQPNTFLKQQFNMSIPGDVFICKEDDAGNTIDIELDILEKLESILKSDMEARNNFINHVNQFINSP